MSTERLRTRFERAVRETRILDRNLRHTQAIDFDNLMIPLVSMHKRNDVETERKTGIHDEIEMRVSVLLTEEPSRASAAKVFGSG
jgi:predicted acyltransferase (DUF342 family)